MRTLRVFPRQTNLTPRDDMAFVGDPPLWKPEADEVHVSVTFTWDRSEGTRLWKAWAQHYPIVKLGGPAFDSPNDGFIPGMYVRPGVVFTSRGCNRRCPWCLVPVREGKLRLLPIQDGYMVNDNNLLQCPREHVEAVFDMLRRQKKPAEFTGGIDARLVTNWFADLCKTIRIHQLFLACDTESQLRALKKAAKVLSFLGQNKLRCYVLIGFNGESLEQAESRLRRVFSAGVLPFAQLYQPPDKYIHYDSEWRHYDSEWRHLARRWCRPAVMKAIMRD